jgi:hypothetical protein
VVDINVNNIKLSIKIKKQTLSEGLLRLPILDKASSFY